MDFEQGYPSSVKGGTAIAADVDDREEHASGSSIQRRTGRRRVVSVSDELHGHGPRIECDWCGPIWQQARARRGRPCARGLRHTVCEDHDCGGILAVTEHFGCRQELIWIRELILGEASAAERALQ